MTKERDFDPVTGMWFPRIESRPSEFCRAAAAFKAMTGMEPVYGDQYVEGIRFEQTGKVKLADYEKGVGYKVLHAEKGAAS